MKTFVITGAAGGICRATVDRLRAKGHRVVGVDIAGDVEIKADLATPAGRDALVAEVAKACPDGIDGVLAGAGIANPERQALMIAVNYFGAIATLEGLRPLLREGGRAVAICSLTSMLPANDSLVQLCLEGDEAQACDAAAAMFASAHDSGDESAAKGETFAYGASKRALALWLRQAAITRDWAGSGKLLNAIAPGIIRTAMTEFMFQDPAMLAMVRQSSPIAVENYAGPEVIAEVADFLLNLEGNYLLGQIIYADGGSSVLLRPEHP